MYDIKTYTKKVVHDNSMILREVLDGKETASVFPYDLKELISMENGGFDILKTTPLW